jgi:hypothetical protein
VPAAELTEDVLDARQVRLRLDQLLLGPPSSPLMTPDAGHLLEQWPALLGAERQGLVDHPLSDEQEGVVGEVGRIEQVDQVAQADPTLVQEVVVLAGAVEAPPEFEDAEIDRQQAIGVVRTSVTSAIPWAERLSEPAQMTSSALRERSARPCSPSAQRRASRGCSCPTIRSDDGTDAGPETRRWSARRTT